MSPETKRSQLGPPVHDSSRAPSPDELRNLAATVEFSGAKDQRGEYADAAVELRKFADVIEHCEDLVPPTHPTAYSHGRYSDGLIDNAATVLRIARGETNERESNGPADRA